MLNTFAAVERGDAKEVEQLLTNLLQEDPQAINETDYRNRTALHLAVERGHEDVVDVLLRYDRLDLSAKECSGFTALHVAAELGRSKIVGRLLEKDPRLASDKVSNEQGLTALHLAALKGHATIVRQLLATSMDSGAVDSPALHLALQYGQEEVATMLMEHTRAKNDRECFGILYFAIEYGHQRIVAQLLAQRPRLIDIQDREGMSALHIAAKHGQEAILDMLLARERGGLATRRDRRGQTLLHYAVLSGHETIVARLLAQQPDLVDVRDEAKEAPLHLAVRLGHENIASSLIDAKLRMSSVRELQNEKEGYLPDLHSLFGVRQETEDLFSKEFMQKVWQLIPENIRVNHVTNRDNNHTTTTTTTTTTPLHTAIRSDNQFAIELLLPHLSLDEIVGTFAELQVECPHAVLDELREPLMGSLMMNEDAAVIVYEYLGLTFTARPNKRMRESDDETEREESNEIAMRLS